MQQCERLREMALLETQQIVPDSVTNIIIDKAGSFFALKIMLSIKQTATDTAVVFFNFCFYFTLNLKKSTSCCTMYITQGLKKHFHLEPNMIWQ